MSRSFIVSRLAPEGVSRALPLLNVLRPGSTVQDWQALAHCATGSDDVRRALQGIMVCQSGTGYIRGLFTYRVGGCEPAGGGAASRTLCVDNVIALGLFDTPATMAALLDTIDLLARDLACAEVRIDVTEHPAEHRARDVVDAFARHGYADTDGALVKTVPPQGPEGPTTEAAGSA
ncbi:hypothetical protein [Azospirillum sp. TSO35-2]|uniref:hypothetical protein n=1 Tax=Azospirillum sp. TSO35-2 TaxID=716796 RepID=UPI000D61CF8F|nr:hypothetical protein [Azospirillum sp. TSO35-2]PWC35945.1 hypothetical protein TSO352_12095 [Azospirillum sp. TSO35-2]